MERHVVPLRDPRRRRQLLPVRHPDHPRGAVDLDYLRHVPCDDPARVLEPCARRYRGQGRGVQGGLQGGSVGAAAVGEEHVAAQLGRSHEDLGYGRERHRYLGGAPNGLRGRGREGHVVRYGNRGGRSEAHVRPPGHGRLRHTWLRRIHRGAPQSAGAGPEGLHVDYAVACAEDPVCCLRSARQVFRRRGQPVQRGPLVRDTTQGWGGRFFVRRGGIRVRQSLGAYRGYPCWRTGMRQGQRRRTGGGKAVQPRLRAGLRQGLRRGAARLLRGARRPPRRRRGPERPGHGGAEHGVARPPRASASGRGAAPGRPAEAVYGGA
mmetsp:Transcript_32896/g.91610  ORF Transcript_32896/g.91610 Transcript_32896/m.91610 type:complete len:321 (+) Transcript_32896:126-1088(+)